MDGSKYVHSDIAHTGIRRYSKSSRPIKMDGSKYVHSDIAHIGMRRYSSSRPTRWLGGPEFQKLDDIPPLPVDQVAMQQSVTSEGSDTEPELRLEDIYESPCGRISVEPDSTELAPEELASKKMVSRKMAPSQMASSSNEMASNEDHEAFHYEDDASEDDAFGEDVSVEDFYDEVAYDEEHTSEEHAFNESASDEDASYQGETEDYGGLACSGLYVPATLRDGASSDGLGSEGSDVLFHHADSSPPRSEMSVSYFGDADRSNDEDQLEEDDGRVQFSDSEDLDWKDELSGNIESTLNTDSVQHLLATYISDPQSMSRAELTEKMCEIILEQLIEACRPFDLQGLISSRRSRALLYRDIKVAVIKYLMTTRKAIWRAAQNQVLKTIGVGVHPVLLKAARETLMQAPKDLKDRKDVVENEEGSAYIWPDSEEFNEPSCPNEFVLVGHNDTEDEFVVI